MKQLQSAWCLCCWHACQPELHISRTVHVLYNKSQDWIIYRHINCKLKIISGDQLSDESLRWRHQEKNVKEAQWQLFIYTFNTRSKCLVDYLLFIYTVLFVEIMSFWQLILWACQLLFQIVPHLSETCISGLSWECGLHPRNLPNVLCQLPMPSISRPCTHKAGYVQKTNVPPQLFLKIHVSTPDRSKEMYHLHNQVPDWQHLRAWALRHRFRRFKKLKKNIYLYIFPHEWLNC